MLVTDTYGRRCAVTREKALPVLPAAHIRPVSEGGAHRVDNGLLLRSDVHTLFDRGYLTVTPAFKLRVSRRLRDDFDNGEHYYQYEKSDLWVSGQAEDRPSKECVAELEFHDPKTQAMAVVSEAGELAAEYRWMANAEADAWSRDPEHRSRVAREAAEGARGRSERPEEGG